MKNLTIILMTLLLMSCATRNGWAPQEAEAPYYQMERAYLELAERTGIMAADVWANPQYQPGTYHYSRSEYGRRGGSHYSRSGSTGQSPYPRSVGLDLFGIHIIGIHNR